MRLAISPHGLGPLVERLNLFARRVRQAGARPFYSLPPIPESDWKEPERAHPLAVLSRHLPTLLEMPVLEPEVPVYPDDAFFDSSYHLTQEGARFRTRALIVALRAQLADPSSR